MTSSGRELPVDDPASWSVKEAEALAHRHGMSRVGVRPPLLSYLGDVWRRRHFVAALAEGDFISRHQNNYLGMLWAILNPMLLGVAYYLIFGELLETTRGTDNYVLFLTAGLFTFIFFSGALTSGSRAIIGRMSIVRSLRFPRLILPCAVTVAELLHALPAFAILLVIALLTGEQPSLEWLLFPVAILIVGVMLLGIVMILARVLHAVRDTGNLIPLLVRMLRYVSGVFFSIQAYASGIWGVILEYQPVAIALTMVRETLLESAPLRWETWAVSGGWAVLFLVVGVVVFWRGEGDYGRA